MFQAIIYHRTADTCISWGSRSYVWLGWNVQPTAYIQWLACAPTVILPTSQIRRADIFMNCGIFTSKLLNTSSQTGRGKEQQGQRQSFLSSCSLTPEAIALKSLSYGFMHIRNNDNHSLVPGGVGVEYHQVTWVTTATSKEGLYIYIYMLINSYPYSYCIHTFSLYMHVGQHRACLFI